MNALQEFIHMGGYAFYVWTAYGIAALVLIGNIIHAQIRHRQVIRQIRREEEQS
ncbi:heme exporter protein CcmD [Candidatus Nitrosacidococcus sp. I8]|uniref:heme exporter protein CcmD n=1 Tax=Candidatus Nitrosacidococcus sp. I8 TaxID=2942908 RepID=UPI002226B7AD|nr:heme exporter protein CcmD [Candidatus Nitrosacidococcus sp. I8]CAH9018978.1 hypothetical protein NURINAE_01255 [Candidatus Nitrosacidococcus sp. I8]